MTSATGDDGERADWDPMTPLWPAVAALHLGRLHAHEQLVVLLVAFGPFAVLVVVVLVLRHREEARSGCEAERRGTTGTGRPSVTGPGDRSPHPGRD